MRHAPSGIDIDLILGGLQFELDTVAAATPYRFGPLTIRLPRVEDLMIMKTIAQRPRDMPDLEALLSQHPDSDLGRVRQFLDEFARPAAAFAIRHIRSPACHFNVSMGHPYLIIWDSHVKTAI